MNNSKYAAKDPAVEAAMEALGVNRRDHIASFEGGNQGRNAREERFEKLRAKEEADIRRAKRESAAATGDGMAKALNAWHTASNFEVDHMAAHSEDISGGQSHRARLREMRESGQLRDIDEPRPGRSFGQQRNNQPQARLTSGDGNYVAVGGAATVPDGARRTASSTTPRAYAGLQSAPIPTNSSSGRAAPPRPDGSVRPPSPRAQGTVRFGPGGQRTERPAAAVQKAAPLPTAARPVLAAPSSAPRAVPSPSAAPRTVSGASSSTASTLVPSRSVSRASVPSHSTTVRNASGAGNATAATRPSTGPGAPALFTAYQPDDYIRRNQMQNKALLFAATPGTACDNFVRSDPEAAGYLQEARRRLINEVTDLVKDNVYKEMEKYIQTHQERKWMMAAALKAKELFEYASDDEVRAHYKQHQDDKVFFETALIIHGSHRPITADTTTSRSTSSATTVVASAPLQAAMNDGQARSVSSNLKPTAVPTPASTDRQTNAVQPLTTSTPSAPAQTRQGNSQARPTPTAFTSAPTQTVQNNLQARPAVTSLAPQPNGSVSTASSRSSLRFADTDVTIPPAKRGTLNITFVDANGKFLKYEQVKVDAPVNGTITLNSTSSQYDPRTFFAPLKAVAERELVDRTRGLEGAMQADDGIWMEQDDVDSDEEL